MVAEFKHNYNNARSSFRVGHRLDKLSWRWCSIGIFSVNSAYRMLSDEGTRDGQANMIWRLRIPLKVKVFCWLVLKKRPLTADNLIKRGWTGDTACMMCRTYDESADYLFTQCVFIKYIMVLGLEDVQAGELGNDVQLFWDRWTGRKGAYNRKNGLSELAACWWTIWKAKNNLIFRNVQLDPVLAVQKLKLLISF